MVRLKKKKRKRIHLYIILLRTLMMVSFPSLEKLRQKMEVMKKVRARVRVRAMERLYALMLRSQIAFIE